MLPLITFLAWVIQIYIWIIVIGAVLSWLILFDVINNRNRAILMVADSLNRLTEPALRPIRRHIPDVNGVDISPIILIVLLVFLRDVVLLGWLLRLAV